MQNWLYAQRRQHLELRDEYLAQGHVVGMWQGCISSSALSRSTLTHGAGVGKTRHLRKCGRGLGPGKCLEHFFFF